MPCKSYKITSTAPFKIIQFNPCCGNPISPLTILNPPGITYICSSTVPILPTGVSYTLMGECCISTPTPTKTPTPTPTKTPAQCACFTANNTYNFSIGIKYTNCYNIPDQGIMVPAFGTVQFCALSISNDIYGIASPTGICSNNQNCNVPTPTPTKTKTPTPTPTKTKTPTPTPTKTKTPTPTRTKTPTPTPTKPICKNYKITVTSVFEIIQFTPCCGSPSSPMSVGQGITYVCSFTFPSVPTGVSCTLFGDCPTCPTPTPTPTKTKTPTPTKTKTPTPTPTKTLTPTPTPFLPCQPCNNQVNLPLPGNSTTYNGNIIISATGTGDIETNGLPTNFTTACGFGNLQDAIVLGSSINPFLSPFAYTLNFSQPVNYISIVLFGYNSNFNSIPGESFTITTNTGNNIPEIILCSGCCAEILGNTISATTENNDCNYIFESPFGAGQFIINNSQPFTSFTISGNGRLAGTTITICDSIPPTPTPTPTCVGITNNTIYIKYNTIP